MCSCISVVFLQGFFDRCKRRWSFTTTSTLSFTDSIKFCEHTVHFLCLLHYLVKQAMLPAEAGEKISLKPTKMESKCSCYCWHQLKYEIKPDWSAPFLKIYFNWLDNRVSKDIALVSSCEILLCMLAQSGTMDSTSRNFVNTRWYFALLCELPLNTLWNIAYWSLRFNNIS